MPGTVPELVFQPGDFTCFVGQMPPFTPPWSSGGFDLAQGGADELHFPAQIFIGLIYGNYGPYKHPGAVFANFAAQVGFL